jgi:hypothetical protein
VSKTIQTVLTVQVFGHLREDLGYIHEPRLDHVLISQKIECGKKGPGTRGSISHSTPYFPSAAQAHRVKIESMVIHKARGLARGVRLRKGLIML